MPDEKPILCIYHGNCADGFTAAWAVKVSMPGVEFVPGVYGDPLPDVSNRHVLIVDFSYKREVLEALAKDALSITVLDHHKSAAADLSGYPTFADAHHWMDFLNNDGRGIHTVFDMARSGAGLTWDFFQPQLPRPNLINYVEDRDLWLFKLDGSRAIAAYVFSHDYTFENWSELGQELATEIGFIDARNAGEAIERKHNKDVRELVRVTKRRLVIGGEEVWAANLPYTYASDAGNMLAEGQPFAATYFDADGVRNFSLRSKPEGADVSVIAAGYGGGGHKNAAGFRVALADIAQFEVPLA